MNSCSSGATGQVLPAKGSFLMGGSSVCCLRLLKKGKRFLFVVLSLWWQDTAVLVLNEWGCALREDTYLLVFPGIQDMDDFEQSTSQGAVSMDALSGTLIPFEPRVSWLSWQPT